MAGPHAVRASRRRRATRLSGGAAAFPVTLRHSLLAGLFVLICASFAAYAVQNPDFAGPEPVIDLTGTLTPYHAAAANENDDSRWFLTTVANRAVRPVTRILLVDQPSDAGLRIFPRRGRAAIRQV